MLAYAIQIYCDFSGYTDMAIGSAHMLGFKLAQNFNMPYLATNISDFWRRWHISLSSWLRDYLFIPLGGSRGSHWQINRNLLVTMTLGGLWHGASWTFVAWGVLHGLLLIGHRLFRDFCSSRPGLSRWLQSSPGMLGRMALTFFCVSLGWVLFRATTFTAAATFIERLFVPNFGMDLPYSKQSLLVLTGVLMSCHLLAGTGWWKKLSERVPAPLMGTGYAVVLSLTLLIRPIAGQAFIYFQF
jgi:alginate O-acetyltransferase complex protein AlgI